MERKILDEIRACGFSFRQLAERYPEFLTLKDVPQNPEYHAEGDVFIHTEMVCDRLTRLEGWQELPEREQELLFLAAAFHDIGKPPCTKLEGGKWTSPRHTIVGEKVFRAMAYRGQDRFGLTFDERELAAKLIRCHGLPVWFLKKRRPEFDLLKAAESFPLRFLYLLSKADTEGRRGREPGRLAEQLELFEDYGRELGVWDRAYPFSNPYTRYQYFHKDGLWQGAELYDDTEFDVVLLAGLPLAGKDTWISRHKEGRNVISLDDIREEYGISPEDGSAKVAAVATRRAKVLLRKKEPFIWNATNIIQETRQKLVGLFAAYGARVHLIYLEAPYQKLLSRNQKRERKIPPAVLEEMIRKLEVPAPWEAYEVQYLTKEEGEKKGAR